MDLPRQIGPFRVVRRLGYGGMAEVFLAVVGGAAGFEKWVAIKTLLPAFQGDPVYERLLIDEAVRAARFQHRNLVQVHDLGFSDGRYWVRMDWVDGLDLATLIARAPLNRTDALFVLEEIALALHHLHALRDEQGRPLGLVHRDVSPSNVLVSRHGEVKLGDFGIAKATMLREVTQAGTRKGKYAYMSPEQVTGDALDAASDQFSLAILAVELLTGRRPFEAESPLLVMDRIRAAAPPPLASLPPPLVSLLHRMLHRDAARRMPDLAAVVDALSAIRRTLPDAGVLTLAEHVTLAATPAQPAARGPGTVHDTAHEPEST